MFYDDSQPGRHERAVDNERTYTLAVAFLVAAVVSAGATIGIDQAINRMDLDSGMGASHAPLTPGESL